MYRHLTATENLVADTCVLGREEARHLQTVLRVRLGAPVQLFDGGGRTRAFTVTALGGGARGLTLTAGGPLVEHPPPPCRLTLYACVNKRMDWTIEKAVELGVSEIVPVISERTVVRVGGGGDADAKAGRWTRVAEEGARQCGTAWLPRVHPPLAFADTLALVRRAPPVFVASLAPGASPLLKGWGGEAAGGLYSPLLKGGADVSVGGGLSPIGGGLSPAGGPLPRDKTLKVYSRDLRTHATRHEDHLWYDFLRQFKPRFTRQRIVDGFILDFFCHDAMLAVELDGSQHFEPDAEAYDKARTDYLNSLGIEVKRFGNHAVDTNFEGVCLTIRDLVERRLQACAEEEQTPGRNTGHPLSKGGCKPPAGIPATPFQKGAVQTPVCFADTPFQKGACPPQAGWFVGPEGDFTPGELDALVQAGALPVSLGRNVLRAETACIYGLCVLNCLWLQDGGQGTGDHTAVPCPASHVLPSHPPI